MWFAIFFLGLTVEQAKTYIPYVIDVLRQHGLYKPPMTFSAIPDAYGMVYDANGDHIENIAFIGIPRFGGMKDPGQRKLKAVLLDMQRATGLAASAIDADVFANFGGDTQ